MLLPLLSLTAIAFMLWLLFAFATYALPFWAGVGSAMLAHATGAGLATSILIGIVSAGLVIGFGEALFARLRSPIARTALTLLFAAPAAVATWFAARGVLAMSVNNPVWLIGLSSIAAVAAAMIAWHRLAAGVHLPRVDHGPDERRGNLSAQPPVAISRPGPGPWPARPRRR
jgi:hypothetical protein